MLDKLRAAEATNQFGNAPPGSIDFGAFHIRGTEDLIYL